MPCDISTLSKVARRFFSFCRKNRTEVVAAVYLVVTNG